MPDGRLLRETPRGESVIQVSVVNDLEQVTALKGSVAQEAWVVLPAGADQQFHGHRRGEAEVPEFEIGEKFLFRRGLPDSGAVPTGERS